MAQNIIMSWLVDARFIELKTVQTLDELDVNKPCIDIQDEGYNVEWSQELRIFESLDEYLRAWVLIHALHHKFGFPGERPGMIFNMSVGYNLEGMLKPNVQWFFDTMADASAYLPGQVDIVAERYPPVREIDIPAQLSDTITLSTMHGCPPDEIEKIMVYLLEERNLHSSVKLNPTLLGADCETACPTSGTPYVDKPRLYLDRGDFEEEQNNAFMIFDDGTIESRIDGETHRLALNGSVEYRSPRFTASFDKETFELLEAAPTGAGDGEVLPLEPAADMFILLKGLRSSMAHLPAMAADGSQGTFVEHPGYED